MPSKSKKVSKQNKQVKVDNSTPADVEPLVQQSNKDVVDKPKVKSKATPTDDEPVVQQSKEVTTQDVDDPPTVSDDVPDNKPDSNDNDSNDNDSNDNDSAENQWDLLELHEKVSYILTEVTAFKQALRNLEPKLKEIVKGCKAATKGKKKTKQSDEKKKNHGVLKLHDVQDEVTNFLGIDGSQQVSRKDLLTGVCDYIRENKLQNPNAKKEFTLDDKMKTVLIKRKNKETKQYEDIVDDTLVYTQIMGAISYWFDQTVDHSSSEVSTA